MKYKKLFFPIGGGDELEQRLYGAFLIARHFDTHLEVLNCSFHSNKNMYHNLAMPEKILDEIEEITQNKYKEEKVEFKCLFEKVLNQVAKEVPLDSSSFIVSLNIKKGLRSAIIEQESKYCDMVIAAAPPSGVTTATFETAVLKSGKSVLMFPRIMRKFSMDSVLIGWNNSTEASRAMTNALPILIQAQKVHIVSSLEYVQEEYQLQKLADYLALHNIEATYALVETTRIPGQALLNAALDGNFDLIVAGAYGHKGLKELMFGGATRYLLENATLPVFMSH